MSDVRKFQQPSFEKSKNIPRPAPIVKIGKAQTHTKNCAKDVGKNSERHSGRPMETSDAIMIIAPKITQECVNCEMIAILT